MHKQNFMVTARGLTSSLILMLLSSSVYAGWGNTPGWGLQQHNSAAANQKTANQPPLAVAPQVTDIAPQAVGISVVSTVPKLFWADCGPNGFTTMPNNGWQQLCSGNLSYIDPALPAPLPVLNVAGATFVTNNWTPRIGIMSGVLNPTTYQLSGIKEAFVYYFKLGRLYKVDTTTLVTTQVSNEMGATPAALCQVQEMNNLTNPLNTTLAYRLKGLDGICNTGDDLTRAVKLSMLPTAAPIALTSWPIHQMLNGTYLAIGGLWPNSTIQRCPATLTGCVQIGIAPGGNVNILDQDPSRVLVNAGATLSVFNSTTNLLTPLYTMLTGEALNNARLDRNGFVYFMVAKSVAPYINSLRRVPVGGGPLPTVMATFTTTFPVVNSAWLDISATHLGFSYPNPTFSGQIYRTLPKAGGLPVVISNDMVNGGLTGTTVIEENSLGTVRMVNATTGLATMTRANSGLNGATYGGTADWQYGFTPTARYFLSDINNQLKSYGMADNFALPTSGIVMGIIPVNLGALSMMAAGNDLLVNGYKTGGMGNGGNDMLFIRAVTLNSMRRLTNSFTLKINSRMR